MLSHSLRAVPGSNVVLQWKVNVMGTAQTTTATETLPRPTPLA
jgi:hypothetical protein